ncbi:MAG: hypothetical protein LC107_04380 [Chitinophagales bacterium]|nr:hypothetical protein [Chitinophagales bacterium]
MDTEAKLAPSHIIAQIIPLILLLFGNIGAIILLIYCIIISFISFNNIVKGLTYSYLIFLVNPVLFNYPLDSFVSFLRFAFIILVFFIVMRRFLTRNDVNIPILTILLFSLILIIHSIFFSYSLEISSLKIFSFTTGSIACIGSVMYSTYNKSYWESWFFNLFFLIVILSIPILFFPHIGMARYTDWHTMKLFQGITNHPQTFSVTLSLPISYCLAKIIAGRSNKLTIFFLFTSLYFLINESKGRTGLVSVVLAMVLVLIFIAVNKNNIKLITNWMLFATKRIKLTGFILLALLLFPVYQPIFQKFLFKRNQVSSLKESFDISRAVQLSKMYKNINNNFNSGIGFGLESNPKLLEKRVKRDPYFNIPISAATEKGFLPLAILEELGIWLSIFGLVLLIILIIKIISINSLALSILTITSLTSNIGENFFFSLGGLGLLMWLLIGLSLKKY